MIWDRWLRRTSPPVEYDSFRHFEYVEQSAQRLHVEEWLVRLVHSYHTRSRADINLLSLLGYPQTAQVMTGDQRPASPETRRAHLAEILACEFACEQLGFELPVFRLRFNPNPDQSMKGDDILAFRTVPTRGVLIGEAKYRSSYGSRPVLEAYDALRNGFRPHPASIDFVATVLELEGERIFADQVRQIKNLLDSQAGNVERAHLLFLVTSGRPRDPFGCIEAVPEAIPNLVAVNVSLAEGINEWINQVFERGIAA